MANTKRPRIRFPVVTLAGAGLVAATLALFVVAPWRGEPPVLHRTNPSVLTVALPPSGDAPGAEEVFAIVQALLPARASVERVPCSSPDHAPDVVARLNGTGSGRVLLVGHVDTVVAHDDHRPLVREQDRLVGSGAIDM